MLRVPPLGFRNTAQNGSRGSLRTTVTRKGERVREKLERVAEGNWDEITDRKGDEESFSC